MRFTRETRYAILFATYMYRRGENYSVIAEAAEDLNVSRTFLEQVARKLKDAGITEAKKGPNGGHKMRFAATTVGEIVTAMCEYTPTSDLLNGGEDSPENTAMTAYLHNFEDALHPILSTPVFELANRADYISDARDRAKARKVS